MGNLPTPIASNYHLIPNADISGIGDAIRERDGGVAPILSGAMPARIRAIPNKYTAADRSKVVVDTGNGNYELQAQDEATYDTNGTRDTTTIKRVTVSGCYEPYVDIGDFERIVKNGNGPRRFPLHSRIRVGPDLYAEVVSYDTDIDLDDPTAHTVTLFPVTGLRKHEFDARQKFVIALENMLAQQYAYKVGSNAWRTVTLKQAIPTGGYIVFTGDDHTNVASYKANGSLIEEDGATAWIVSTHIEDLNGQTLLTNGTSADGYTRALYGSNCYLRSDIRKYLTGASTTWTRGIGSGDFKWNLLPSYTMEVGYQGLLDAAVLAKLKRVAIVCAISSTGINSEDPDNLVGDTYTITTDKIFLPSITNLGLGLNGNVAEGPVWQAFDPTAPGNLGYYERIRKDQTRDSLLNYATRSAVLSTAHQIYEGTQIAGTATQYDANSSSLAVVPAFVV